MQGDANGTAPLIVGGYNGCVHGYMYNMWMWSWKMFTSSQIVSTRYASNYTPPLSSAT